MRSLAALLAGVLVVTVVLFWPRTVDPPADVALPPIPHIDRPLRLTFFGTSLTANYNWPEHAGDHLAACLGQSPQINRVAKSGAGSDWALTRITEVVASNPDVILIEFSINDADLRDGKSLAAARSNHRRIIAELRLALPDTRIVLIPHSPSKSLISLS